MKKMKRGKAVTEAEESSLSELLPDDIMIHHIFIRLPVKSILRFRCVCKSWLNLFRNPNFIKNHYKHAVEKEKFKFMLMSSGFIYSSPDYFDPSLTSFEISEIDSPFDGEIDICIWGECNGLLCIVPFDWERICIWNPSTKEYKVIPLPEDPYPSQYFYDLDNETPAFGFGYDSSIEDYKLVRIFNFLDINNSKRCEIKIYTFGSNLWKDIPVIYPYIIGRRGVLVNGILHWIGDSHDSDVIVSLDFRVERFVEMPIPEHLDNKQMDLSVGALGGCLCIFDAKSHEDVEVGFVVWVMKEYGVRESWTKLFTIVQQSLFRPRYELIQSFSIGESLIYIDSIKPNEHALVLYDPNNERVRPLKIHGGNWSDAMASNWYHTNTYVESLVSLNTGTYVVQKEYQRRCKVKKLTTTKNKNKKKVGERRVAEPEKIESDEAYDE